MFCKHYGMELTKYEEWIKYFENRIKIGTKLKNYQYYDLANSLNFNNNNNDNNDSNSQNRVKQSNPIEMTKLFFKLSYSNDNFVKYYKCGIIITFILCKMCCFDTVVD